MAWQGMEPDLSREAGTESAGPKSRSILKGATMSSSELFRGHRFDIEAAEIVAQTMDRPMWVGRTPSGTWFIYDDSAGGIKNALLPGDNVTAFAESLVWHGFAEVVLDHFPAEEDVIPEA
jgi:hypothetical protein